MPAKLPKEELEDKLNKDLAFIQDSPTATLIEFANLYESSVSLANDGRVYAKATKIGVQSLEKYIGEHKEELGDAYQTCLNLVANLKEEYGIKTKGPSLLKRLFH